MKAKELYKTLETELRPLMTTRGFKKRSVSRLTFQRSVGDKYHTVWFQCDKYGWDSYAGGEFFANFTVSESPDPESGARRDERLNFFLTDAELDGARDYRDQIVERIPKPPEFYFENLESQFSKSVGPESAASLVKTVRDRFEPGSIPYRRHQDFALRYWQTSDVSWWAALIASVLPRAIEQMESWSLPPYDESRVARAL
jgi:hypothetical protein